MSLTHGRNVVSCEETRDQPFDPEVVTQAQALAARYHIDIRRVADGYTGTVTEFPTVFGHGPSEDAAMSTTRELLKWALAYLIETGRTPTAECSSSVPMK
jgi:predicted RNase H-like HicB family nuclease